MQLLGRKKRNWNTIIISLTLFLSGCAFTNLFLWDEGNEGDRTTLPVTLDTLIEMGEYSKLIYTKKGIFAEGTVTPDEPEFYGLSKMISNQAGAGKRNEYSYYVIQEDGITILIFRGTANTENLKTDIDMRMWHDEEIDLYFHRGFRDAADILWNDIRRNQHLEHTVYLTGHSLGGAVAQIIGMWLHKRGYNVQVFTFGAPKVTTTFLFNEPNHWRVAVRSDPVSYMPSLPYVHSGIHIDPETLDWDESHIEDSMLGIDGLDHSIKDYLDMLYNHSDCDAKCRGSQEIRD